MLFHGPGRPLELVRAPVPQPQGGEILVRVTCCTLCTSDLHTHAGRRPEPTPSVLGHEIVGRVAALGPDVAGGPVAVDGRVTWGIAVGCGRCFFCTAGLPQKCERLVKYGHRRVTPGRPFAGGLADYVLLEPGTVVVPVPDAVPDAVAAPMACAGATAAAVVRAAAPAVAGGVVLVFGAGPLGLSAAAMARAAGALAVVVSDPDPDRRQRATEFGATHTVEPDAVTAAVSGLTAGRGADAALELAGSADAVRAALACVRVGGTVVLAGTVLPTEPVAVDPEAVVRRLLTVRGVHNYAPADLAAAVAFPAGPGKSAPWADLVGQTFPLAEAESAIGYAHAHRGTRVAVVP
jgi:alcohol dehydrogenase